MSTHALRFTIAVLVLLAPACFTKPSPNVRAADAGADLDVAAATPDAITPADAFTVALPTIVITSPAAPTSYTNGSVSVQLAVTGAPAATSVDLLLSDGTVLASLSAPFHFSWDTTTVGEGTYSISARATVAGQNFTSSNVLVVVDRTPPTIISQSPAPGSTNVAVADPIALTFSEPLAPSAVGPAAITISAGTTALPATTTLSADGATIAVALTIPPALSLPTTLNANIRPSLTDRAGNPVSPTSDWSWTLPSWVDLGSVPGGFPSLALDTSDHIYVTTTNEDTPGSSVYTLHVNRLAADNTWNELLSPAVGTVDPITSIAVDSTGAPLVAWSQGHVYLARWVGGELAPWDLSYGTVDDLPALTAHSPSLALDSTNNPTIVWAYPNGHVDLDYAARWNTTTLSWQRLFADPNTPVAAGTPALRLDPTGSPLVIAFINAVSASLARLSSASWQTFDTSSPQAYAPDAVVTDARPDATARPTIVIPSASASQIRVTSFNGTSWQDFGPIITTGQGVGDARIAFAGPTPVVLWTEGGQRIRVARLLQNAWNYSAGSIASISGLPASMTSPVLALDSKGHVVVAWTETTPDQRLTFTRRSNR